MTRESPVVDFGHLELKVSSEEHFAQLLQIMSKYRGRAEKTKGAESQAFLGVVTALKLLLNAPDRTMYHARLQMMLIAASSPKLSRGQTEWIMEVMRKLVPPTKRHSLHGQSKTTSSKT